MHQVTKVARRTRAKLLSSLAIFAVMAATIGYAKDVEFEFGSDAAVARAAAQAIHVGLNTAGISCSVDSAYGPDFLWTSWFDSAVLTIDARGGSSLILFNAEGGRVTRCDPEAGVRVAGAIDIDFQQTATGAQYVVHTSGSSMGLVQLSVRDMISRISTSTEAATIR